MCEMEGCVNEINRDGLCFKHKIKTVRTGTKHLAQERRGEDLTGGMGTTEYVRRMYERRRAAGMPDPEPENRKAARYAPPRGVLR